MRTYWGNMLTRACFCLSLAGSASQASKRSSSASDSRGNWNSPDHSKAAGWRPLLTLAMSRFTVVASWATCCFRFSKSNRPCSWAAETLWKLNKKKMLIWRKDSGYLNIKEIIHTMMVNKINPQLHTILYIYTVQAKSLDTPSHSMRFLYFHDYLHCRFSLATLKKLEYKTCFQLFHTFCVHNSTCVH